MRLKNYRYLCMLFWLCLMIFPAYVYSDLFPMPKVDQEEEIAFVYLNSPAEKETFVTDNSDLNQYINFYILLQHKWIKEQGKLKVVTTLDSIEKNIGIFQITVEYLEKDGFLQQSLFKRTIKSFTGETFLSYRIDFQNFDEVFPDDAVVTEGLMLVLSGIEKVPDFKHPYHWWATESLAMPMYAKVRSPEKITVPAGTFTCYPIKVYVDFADYVDRGKYVNMIVNPFLPDQKLYFDVNPPHYFIHYEGPFGPPGSMEIKTDLVKIIKGEQEIERVRRKLLSPDSYVGDNTLPDIFN